MVTLLSTPECIEQVSPEISSRWVATECPIEFEFLRQDYPVLAAANNAGYLQLQVAAGTFDGAVGDQISVYNKSLNAMYVGEVQAGSTATTIETNIVYIAGFDPTDTPLDPERNYAYFNDNTLHAGYYVEGRLTINGIQNDLTIIASPNSLGYVTLDISGVLRTAVSIGKVTDYTEMIMADTNKSGNFSLEYRECWYGSNEPYIECEGVGSPPDPVLWYYAEAVRSEEQGTNLAEYVADDINEAPFFNLFETPVYFSGYPFDISFIMPERALVSPAGELTVTIRTYNAQNTLQSEDIFNVTADNLEGFVNSLTITDDIIPSTAAYFTAEITAL